jgi:hypothetical protein
VAIALLLLIIHIFDSISLHEPPSRGRRASDRAYYSGVRREAYLMHLIGNGEILADANSVGLKLSAWRMRNDIIAVVRARAAQRRKGELQPYAAEVRGFNSMRAQ